MKPPTKFELMRQNRYAAECRVAGVPITKNVVDAEIARTSPVIGTGIPSLAELREKFDDDMLPSGRVVTATVPTMEFDGVKYREVPDIGGGCDGCAFDANCSPQNRLAARVAFGSACSVRGVIYLRTEA